VSFANDFLMIVIVVGLALSVEQLRATLTDRKNRARSEI
jgi:hypothetical protein